MGSGTMAISFMIPTPFLTSDLLELMDQKARIKMNTEEAIDIIEYVANQLDESAKDFDKLGMSYEAKVCRDKVKAIRNKWEIRP